MGFFGFELAGPEGRTGGWVWKGCEMVEGDVREVCGRVEGGVREGDIY